MAAEARRDPAQQPLPSGPLHTLTRGAVSVDIAPRAGGRIAQIRHRGQAWLVGPDDGYDAAIAWGCYPMLPWAGRLRRGRFRFDGRIHQVPASLGPHAIHGVGFVLPWQLADARHSGCTLRLALPQDARWPFGGQAEQRITLDDDGLELVITLRAGRQAMPRPVIGWHPWLRKPDRLEFHPQAQYPRDPEGITRRPVMPPSAGPWDDCFINRAPVTVVRGSTMLRLQSGCTHWVVYDQPAHATCVEPQSGPPDAFNLLPHATLAPGRRVQAWFRWHWSDLPG